MSASTRTTLARRVRALRVEHGLTQDRLALMVGVEQSYISRIEAGERSPNFDLLVKLAEAFDLSLSKFLDGV